jgi:hypothetical protein
MIKKQGAEKKVRPVFLCFLWMGCAHTHWRFSFSPFFRPRRTCVQPSGEENAVFTEIQQPLANS